MIIEQDDNKAPAAPPAGQQIYTALAQIVRDIEAVEKSQELKAKFGSYRYRGVDDVMAAIHPHLARHGLFVTQTKLSWQTSSYETKAGSVQFKEDVVIRYTIHAPDGSSVSSDGLGSGVDSGDKGVAKAGSVAYREMWLKLFAIPTEESKLTNAEQAHELLRRTDEKARSWIATQLAEPLTSVEQLSEKKRLALASFGGSLPALIREELTRQYDELTTNTTNNTNDEEF